MSKEMFGYKAECDSDVGLTQKVNQDAVYMQHMVIAGEEAVFCVLCDGMGGLKNGELASASVVNAYAYWFRKCFIKQCGQISEETVIKDWNDIAVKINGSIYKYGIKKSIRTGTTAVVLLLWKDRYCIMNAGDSRVYELKDNIVQLTKDHTWIEREVEKGRLTKQQAAIHKKRNVLLRCIGGKPDVNPDFFVGNVRDGAVYMLCSDGVRNKVSNDELYYFFHPSCMENRKAILNNINYIFELNKLRSERDNMTIAIIKAQGKGNEYGTYRGKKVINKKLLQDYRGRLLKSK